MKKTSKSQGKKAKSFSIALNYMCIHTWVKEKPCITAIICKKLNSKSKFLNKHIVHVTCYATWSTTGKICNSYNMHPQVYFS